jgi:hypothetical protein
VADIANRSAVGIYVFSPQSVNEELLSHAGFELIHREDLTENLASMAGRWHDARAQYRDQLVADEGEATFEGVQRFLSAVTFSRASDACRATHTLRSGDRQTDQLSPLPDLASSA